jgi:hypothetical protein
LAAAAARNTRDGPRVAELVPMARPGGAETVSPKLGAAAEAVLRPMRRPGAFDVVISSPVSVAGTGDRPRPRPEDDSDQLAKAVAAAVIAAASAPSEAEVPGSAVLAVGSRPEPRGFFAAAGGTGLEAAPRLHVTPPVQAPPVQAAAASTAVQVARVEAPLRVAPAASLERTAPVQDVAVRQAPVRQVPPAETVSRGSGSVALIGVFGTSSRRHALVQLPNGSVQRVRPGDAVNGVQIAAVGADTVRVRVNGRDGVLRLPD